MIYREINMSLFDVDAREYCFAHNIALDARMGAGIAKKFCQIYPDLRAKVRSFLKNNNVSAGDIYEYQSFSCCIYNMFTKANSGLAVKNPKGKKGPRYCLNYAEYLNAVRTCLENVKMQMIRNKQNKLAMPKIGSGLDNCSFEDVKTVIESVFKDSDIEVLICFVQPSF